MKIEALKKIIKEAVREVLLEEKQALQEITAPVADEESLFSKDLTKPVGPEAIPGDVISEMINMTRNNMTKEDYRSIFNGNSSMVSKPDLRMESSYENVPSGPQPGLDISNLDFVKNAASVFKLAEQKSKGR